MRPTSNPGVGDAGLSWPASSMAIPSAAPAPEGNPAFPPDVWMLGLLHIFRLEREGQIVHRFQRRILDGLLAYLALQPTRAHGRDEIARLFWPDRPLNVALRRLSHVLFSLSRELKELGMPDDAIIADYYNLQLTPEISTDIQQLDALISRAQREPDLLERQRILDDARRLFGDGVLPTMSQPWIKLEQERLAKRLAGLQESLQQDGAGFFGGSRLTGHLAAGASSESLSAGLGGEASAGAGRPVDLAGGAGDLVFEDRLSKAQVLATWLERLEPHLLGPDRARWVQQVSDRDTEIQLTAEWALSDGVSRQDPDLALRFVAVLWRYWYLRSMVQRGRSYAEKVLLTRPAQDSRIYARAVYAAGSLALCSSDHEFAKAWFNESLQMAERLGDERLQSRCQASLGVVAYQEGDLAQARTLLAEGSAAFRATGDHVLLAGSLHNAALVEIDSGDFERAEFLLREYMRVGHRLGDQTILANGLVTLGTVIGHTGSWEKVVPLVAQAQALFEAQGDLSAIALCLRYQAYIAAERGQNDLAQVYLECSLSLCRALHDLPGISESLRLLAEIFEKQGKVSEALALYRDALQLLKHPGHGVSLPLRRGPAGPELDIATKAS